MKLLIAVDRVSLESALTLVDKVAHLANIIEVGTSLIKDYGMESVRQIRQRIPSVTVLADIKTMDEGAYEFQAAFSAGADIASVMGAASIGTVMACCEVADRQQRDVMIDLLGVYDCKIQELASIPHNALYCVHLPVDGDQSGVEEAVQQFCAMHTTIKRVAVSGGITLAHIPFLKRLPIEVCVVGSAITKAKDPTAMARSFYELIHS